MKLCLIQIFFTVTASLSLKSYDDDNVNGLTIMLTVWLLFTPCMVPFLHLLSEIKFGKEWMSKLVRMSSRISSKHVVPAKEENVEDVADGDSS